MKSFTLTIAFNDYGNAEEVKKEYKHLGEVTIEEISKDIFTENSYYISGVININLGVSIDPFEKTKKILYENDLVGECFTCRKGNIIMFTDEHEYFNL